MKKKYVAPRFMCVKVNMTKMLCSSIDGGSDGEGRTANSPQYYNEFEEEDDV